MTTITTTGMAIEIAGTIEDDQVLAFNDRTGCSVANSDTDHTVNMVRFSVEPGGRDQFSCSLSAWELLLELGNTFGWKSLGTTYVPSDLAVEFDNPTRHDYLPSDQQDSKSIDALDALNWATALSEARNSPHLTAMIGNRPLIVTLRETAAAETLSSVSAPFITTMNEFIAYAFGGKFAFSRSP